MPICWAHMVGEILHEILIHILLYLLRLCDYYLYYIIIRVLLNIYVIGPLKPIGSYI